MPTRRPLYLEDYRPGTVFDCGSVTVLEREVIAFAQELGPRPFQPGPSPAGGLVASHWHPASLVMRLIVDGFLSAETSLGSAGVDGLRWPRPVRAGDTLRVQVTVLEASRPGGEPDRGIVRALVGVVNQHGAAVMRMTAITVVAARAARAAVLPGPDPRLDALGDRRP
jgi:acyl dehydratase